MTRHGIDSRESRGAPGQPAPLPRQGADHHGPVHRFAQVGIHDRSTHKGGVTAEEFRQGAPERATVARKRYGAGRTDFDGTVHHIRRAGHSDVRLPAQGQGVPRRPTATKLHIQQTASAGPQPREIIDAGVCVRRLTPATRRHNIRVNA